jgi:hypothetical protein
MMKAIINHRRFILGLLSDSALRRHVFRWIRTLDNDYLINNKCPWIVFDAIDHLNSIDLNHACIFEYGSGGSTLFWLEKNAFVVSIEHDPSWYRLMKKELIHAMNIDYRLVIPEPDYARSSIRPDYSDPDQYLSSGDEHGKCNYVSYTRQIDEFPDQYFDVVLIDGRARPSCIKHSAEKVKVGGMLIIDDSDRTYYFDKTKLFLQHFSVNKFIGAKPVHPGLSSTDIYVRQK